MNPVPAQDLPPQVDPVAPNPLPPVGVPGPPNAEHNEKKPEKKEYDRNHKVRVCGTSSNAKGDLVVLFVVNLSDNERYPNRSDTDYRGQLTMRQMQNPAVAVERLSHSLKPSPQILIADPYEDYAQYLKECFVEWENDMEGDDSDPKETKVFQAQGWYFEGDTWYLVTGRESVWDITNGVQLSEDEIQNLSVNFEFNGTEQVFVQDETRALELLSELISTFHTVGEEKNRSFLPSAMCFFLKIAAELCKVLAANLEFSNQIQVSFVNSMMKQGLKRKRLVGKKVVLAERAEGKCKKKKGTKGLERNGNEMDQHQVNENFAKANEELDQNHVNDKANEKLDRDHIEGNYVERGFAPDVPLADEFLNNNQPGGSGGLRCNNPDCLDFTKTFKREYHYKMHIQSKKHRMK